MKQLFNREQRALQRWARWPLSRLRGGFGGELLPEGRDFRRPINTTQCQATVLQSWRRLFP